MTTKLAELEEQVPGTGGTRYLPCEVRGLLTAQASAVSPLTAASIVAMSIFVIGIIASKARLAAALSRLVVASSRTRGVICQEKPHRSLHQPQALSSPSLSMIAFQ